MTTMRTAGHVESLWRYPVKSMRGESIEEAFVGFAGVYGDRVYAFRSSAARQGFPYLTAREQPLLLQCRAAFRHPERMRRPPNLEDANAMPPGATPLYADAADLMADVAVPNGDVLPIDDPLLIEMLCAGQREGVHVTLLRSDRALTDCRPISLISTATIRQLGDEVGIAIDKRRFRENIYIDLPSAEGFAEDGWVGRRFRIGETAVVAVMNRDERCKMITLDPETAAANPEIMRGLKKAHDACAGVYAVVLIEGIIRRGDGIVEVD